MSEVSIRFYAMPDCPHILQAPAHCATILTTGDHPAGPLRITEVRLNGASMRFRAMDDNTACVSPPIRYEGDRVELVCSTPTEPLKASQHLPATHPAPPMEYGLQRRSSAPMEAFR